MNDVVYIAGDCSICGQGHLLFCKAAQTSQMLVMCDDCEAQWIDPSLALKGLNPLMPGEEFQKVEDATEDEVKNEGWLSFIKTSLPSDS